MNASPASTIAHETPIRVTRPVVVPGSVLFGPRLFPWAVLASAATLGIFAPASTALAAPWPFAIALVLFGMPHGAADWAVASSLSKRLGLTSRLAGFTGYLVLMATSLALIALQPSAAALLFLALTMFHFGMADATALRADDDGPVARWGLALGRGMLLLATAFAMHPAQAWAPFEQIGQALSPWASTAWQPELESLRQFAVMGVAVGGCLALAGAIARIRVGHRCGARPGRTRAGRCDGGDDRSTVRRGVLLPGRACLSTHPAAGVHISGCRARSPDQFRLKHRRAHPAHSSTQPAADVADGALFRTALLAAWGTDASGPHGREHCVLHDHHVAASPARAEAAATGHAACGSPVSFGRRGPGSFVQRASGPVPRLRIPAAAWLRCRRLGSPQGSR